MVQNPLLVLPDERKERGWIEGGKEGRKAEGETDRKEKKKIRQIEAKKYRKKDKTKGRPTEQKGDR